MKEDKDMKGKMTESERQAQLEFSYGGLAKSERKMRDCYLSLLAWERYNKMVEDGVITLTPDQKQYAKLCEEIAFIGLSSAGQNSIEYQKRIAQYERGFGRYMEELRDEFGRLHP